MATIKVKDQDQQELDELNALNDEAELAQLNSQVDISPLGAMKSLAKSSGPLMNALDLERRYASPAAALAAARPELLEESEKGSGFFEGQSQFPSMSELIRRAQVKGGASEAAMQFGKYPREIGGFLADMITPSSVLSVAPATKLAAQFPKISRGLQIATNPIGETLLKTPTIEGIGASIYNRPFRRMDATADAQTGVKRISDLARQYGITGDYDSMLKQLREKLGEEGKNIGDTISKLQGKMSAEDIRIMSEGAASEKLGSMQDRENILNFINNELEMMTPKSQTEKLAKYASEKNRYNKELLDYEARKNEQGRLFQEPDTEIFQETVPVTKQSESSQVIRGDFENFPQSTMGTVEARNPDFKVWEKDIRNPNLSREKSALENIGTIKIAGPDYKGPTLMNEGAPDFYLPIGEMNKYSPKPMVVDRVTRTSGEAPLPTVSARDVNPQTEFPIPSNIEPLVEPQVPIAPDMNIFSLSDLFDLKTGVGKRAYGEVPDATTGAAMKVNKKQAAQIERAYAAKLKKEVESQLPESAPSFSQSIQNYNQMKKNKKGFKRFERAAEKETEWAPNIGVSSVRDLFGFIPPSLSTSLQTKTGRILEKTGKKLKVNPWLIETGGRSLTPLMIDSQYEE